MGRVLGLTFVGALALAGMVSGGCAQGRVTGGVVVPAHSEACLIVLGDSPILKARNRGPGSVTVQIQEPGVELNESPLVVGQESFWGFGKGAKVIVRNRGVQEARLDYVASNAKGVSLDVQPGS